MFRRYSPPPSRSLSPIPEEPPSPSALPERLEGRFDLLKVRIQRREQELQEIARVQSDFDRRLDELDKKIAQVANAFNQTKALIDGRMVAAQNAQHLLADFRNRQKTKRFKETHV